MSALRAFVPVALLSAAAVAGCGSSSSGGSSSTAASSTAAAAPSNNIVVTAKDFSFDAKTLTAPAGKVTITLKNMGMATHEFVVLKTDADPTSLKVDSGGKVSEADSVGEISETTGGKSATHVFNLKAGKYVFVCNVPGHYKDGMAGELTVQ